MNDEDIITNLWHLRDIMSDCGVSWVNQLLKNIRFSKGRSIINNSEHYGSQGIAYFTKDKIFTFWNEEFFSNSTETPANLLAFPLEKLDDMDFIQQCANILKSYEVRNGKRR